MDTYCQHCHAEKAENITKSMPIDINRVTQYHKRAAKVI